MTLSIDYERLHKLCFLDRDHLFGRTINNVYLLDRFSNRLGDVDKDPFIGYFGNEYELQKKKVFSAKQFEKMVKNIVSKGEKTLLFAVYNNNNQRSYLTVTIK